MKYLLNGHSLMMASDLCNGCGRCVEVCPHGVFAMVQKKAEIVNLGDCMECGACGMNCATDAISVESGVGCAQLVVASMWRGNGGRTECGCGG
ncbi:MAG: 4Fe-4S binding protein [Acidobacteria bacterium]|nr:4Fe-4S binding protein [Acidobacteriota bacterium]